MISPPFAVRLALVGSASVGLAFTVATDSLQWGLTAFFVGVGVTFFVWAIASTRPEF